MEVLVLDGKNYVKASKAAKELGYATDYVGQLCRGGQVDAHLIGRTWYVNQEELSTHRVEKKRQSRLKAREYAKKAIEEHKLKVTETPNTYKNIDIHYESDSENLIPETRKISIKSAPVYNDIVDVEDDGPSFTIENPGEKVLMSGSLDVVDVTDAQMDPETTILSPRIQRKQVAPRAVHDSISEAVETKSVPVAKSFIDRLEISEEITPEVSAIPDSSQSSVEEVETIQYAPPLVDEPIASVQKGSVLGYVLILLLMVGLTIFSITLKQVLLFEDGSTATKIVIDSSVIERIISYKI